MKHPSVKGFVRQLGVVAPSNPHQVPKVLWRVVVKCTDDAVWTAAFTRLADVDPACGAMLACHPGAAITVDGQEWRAPVRA